MSDWFPSGTGYGDISIFLNYVVADKKEPQPLPKIRLRFDIENLMIQGTTAPWGLQRQSSE